MEGYRKVNGTRDSNLSRAVRKDTRAADVPQTRETSKASQHVAELIRSGLHTSLMRASAPQRGLRIRLRESLCQAGNARPAPGLLGERVRTISVPCGPPVQRQCLKQVFVQGPAKSGRPVGTHERVQGCQAPARNSPTLNLSRPKFDGFSVKPRSAASCSCPSRGPCHSVPD